MNLPFSNKPPPPFRIAWIGIFFLFGAVMTTLAGVSLVWPGTALDGMWKINPVAHAELSPYGKMAGLLFLGMTPLLAISGAGVLYRRRWSYYASLLLIGANGVGDVVNLLRGDYLKGLTGVFFAGLFMLYLLSPMVREYFLKSSVQEA